MTSIASHFADFIVSSSGFQLNDEPGELLWQLASLACRAVDEGHICLSLDSVGKRKMTDVLSLIGARKEDNLPDSDFFFPSVLDLSSFLKSANAVTYIPDSSVYHEGMVSQRAKGVVSQPVKGVVSQSAQCMVPQTPLVLDSSHRLYLQKYYLYEISLARELRNRACPSVMDIDNNKLKEVMSLFRKLFPYSGDFFDWQDFATWLSLHRQVLIISGGPGTGKTTTVSRILALSEYVHQLSGDKHKGLKIALCAPTGKAAARMGEAIERVKEKVAPLIENMNDLLLKKAWDLPSSASTIHRLLGYRKGSSFFRKSKDSPLIADIVVVDEASMVPLPLMSKLFEALKQGAKIILLGDMNQLASVQPGYVLGDICASATPQFFSQKISDEYEKVSPAPLPSTYVLPRSAKDVSKESKISGNTEALLNDSSVVLTESYRFKAGGVIDRVSKAINEAKTVKDSDSVLALIKKVSTGDIEKVLAFHELKGGMENRWLTNWVSSIIKEKFDAFIREHEPLSVLRALSRFRIICGLRKGFQGVNALNQIVESLLFKNINKIFLKKSATNFYYDHRPVMVVENDYNLSLFNGDVGVALRNQGTRGDIKVWFEDSASEETGFVRSFHPSALPAVETCFAQTVHKSQGSEFDSLLFVLPENDSPVLTKELVYTGITRAMNKVYLVAKSDVLKDVVRRTSSSSSGLTDLL